jgi:biotin synthase
MRKDNKNLKRFLISPSEVLSIAKRVYEDGIKTIMLQSGEIRGVYNQELIDVIDMIKKKYQMQIIICSGIISEEELWRLKNVGVEMYLMKIEIANPTLFEKFRPNTKFTERLNYLYLLKELGYKISTGLIIGTPHQTIEDILIGIKLIKDLNPSAVSISPFISNESTPFGRFSNADYQFTLRIIAILRILFPKADIPSISVLSILSENGQKEGLDVGANVITVNYSKRTNDYPLYNSARKLVNIEYAKELILN